MSCPVAILLWLQNNKINKNRIKTKHCFQSLYIRSENMHGSFIWGPFSLKLSPHKFQLLLRRWLKQFSENINRLPEFNMISMSPSSLNLNINRFVIFLPLYTWIIVPHASWTFFFTQLLWTWCMHSSVILCRIFLFLLLILAICHINKIFENF